MKHSVSKALILFENGKISEALGEFLFVLKDKPDNIPALTGKARCLLNYIYDDKKLKDGSDTIDKIIKDLEHESPDILLLKAKFLWRKRHHNKALRQIEYIKDTWGSEYPELVYTEGRILASHSMKRFKEALELSEKLSAKERNFIQGRIAHLKGFSAQNSEERKRHHIDAIALFKKSFEIDFDVYDDGAVDNLIISSLHVNEKENLLEAIRIGKLFLSKNPNSYIANKIAVNIAQCYVSLTWLTYDFDPNSYAFEMKSGNSFSIVNKTRRKELSQEFIDFIEEMQTTQNELFEPEQIDDVMRTLLHPMFGKPNCYDDLCLHKETITCLNEYWDFHKKLSGKSQHSEYEYYMRFGLTYMRILEHNKALEYFTKYVETIEENHLKDLQSEQDRRYFIPNLVNAYKKILECCRILNYPEKHEAVQIFKKKHDEFLQQANEIRTKRQAANEQTPDVKPPLKYPGNEGEHLELKSSFFMHDMPSDMNKQEKKAKEEKGFAEIAESVCAFLNTDGGEIIIGVDDDKNCLGIEADVQKTKKKTFDAYTQTIMGKVYSFLNEKYPNFVFFSPILYPEDDPKNQVRLYRIFVDKLPDNEPLPSTVTVGSSPPIIYYRTGESDAPFKYEDGIREWIRRKNRRS